MGNSFARVAQGIDTSAALTEVRDHEDLFGSSTWRQEFPGTAHGETQTIYLRHPVRIGPSLFDDLDAPPTEVAGLFPAVTALAAELLTNVGATELGRCMIVRLPAGAKVGQHSDEGRYAEHFDRFHLCLSDAPGNVMICGGEAQEMATGDAWWFNHRMLHAFHNGSDQARLHLIVDCVAQRYRALRDGQAVAVPAPVFAEEGLHPFWEDAMPLFARHWQEVSHYLDIPLCPDLDLYERCAANGMLAIHTVRSAGHLVGYAMFFVRHNGHYSSSLQAVQDVLFIAPEHRKGTLGIRLVAYAEDQLRARGVQAVYHHQKLAHPALGKILERRGYEAVETIWAKRLDRE